MAMAKQPVSGKNVINSCRYIPFARFDVFCVLTMQVVKALLGSERRNNIALLTSTIVRSNVRSQCSPVQRRD